MTETEAHLTVLLIWFGPGLIIGFLWARFMPRWNMVDIRDHNEGCSGEYDMWEDQVLCACPIRHQKSSSDRVRDFLIFTFVWPLALAAISFALSVTAFAWCVERVIEHLRDPLIKFLGGTPNG